MLSWAVRKRGSGLLAVLVLTGLLVATLAIVVQSTTFHHRSSLRQEQNQHARNLAEGMIHRAVAELANRESCGNPARAGDSFAYTSADYPGGGTGHLSFEPEVARNWGIDCSINSLASTVSLPAPTGQSLLSVLPAHTALLFAQGSCGQSRVRMLCLYRRPPFPKGVACTGKAELEGSIVRGLTSATHYEADWNAIPVGNRVPSHVFSNSAESPGLVLGRGCDISGNAGCCGQVQLLEDAHVAGEIRSQAAPQEIPDLNLTELQARFQSMAGLQPIPAAGPVSGFCSAAGDYTRQGELNLDGGALCVQGDLTIQGPLKGRGILLVGGNAVIRGGSSLSAQDQVAVVAGGDILLEGGGSDYFFNGMLYSHSSIRARNLTVLGSLVCQSSQPDRGSVHLDNVSLIQVPVSVTARYGLPLVGTVGNDSFRFNLSRYESNGQALYFGSALYCEDFIFRADDRILEVFWRPGEVEWRSYDRRSQAFLGASRGEYDGSLTSLREHFSYFLTLGSETPGDAISQLDRYVENLEADHRPGNRVLDLNLNRILRSTEPSRIVVLREY